MRALFLFLALTCGTAHAAAADRSLTAVFVASDGGRPEVKAFKPYGDAFVAASKLSVDGIIKIVPIGVGMFNLVFKTRALADAAYKNLPEFCEANLDQTPYALYLNRDGLDEAL